MLQANQTLVKIVKSLKFFDERGFQSLLKSKNYLWKCIKNHIKYSIDYAFNQNFQARINPILTQLDQFFNTQETQKIKQKRNKDCGKLSQKLYKIIKEYEQAIEEEQQKQDQHQLKERILQSIFQSELNRFTLSQLIQAINLKIDDITNINSHKRTAQQRSDIKACLQFKDFIIDVGADTNVVDQMILIRIQQDLNESLCSSTMGEVKPYNTLNSFEEEKILDLLDKFEISQNQTETEVLQPLNTQQTQPITKRPALFMTPVEKKFMTPVQEKPIPLSETISIPKKQEEKILNFIPHNKKKEEQSPSKNTQQTIKKQPIQPNQQTQTQTQKQKQTVANDIFINEIQATQQRVRNNIPPQRDDQNYLNDTLDTNQTFFQQEDRRQNQYRSREIIKRYSTQSRFTNGDFKINRELQVKQIERNQIKPLIEVLKQIKTRQINIHSPMNQPIQVEVYGSFQNKCGFRKISDVNINLIVPGLQQGNVKSTFFELKKLMDKYLDALNLRSVIFSQQHKELILSHINTYTKTKEGEVVNYIFLTINRKEFVESSMFMKDVIYSNEKKSTDITHLSNFVHLLFKTNCILDHKSMYHKWFIKGYEQKMKKQNSQKRFVSISVYSMQMMILFYLKETGIISRIYWSTFKGKFDFELLNQFVTLFENFIGFLKFYSSQGDYKRLYANKTFIDVVERDGDQQTKIEQLTERLSYKIAQSNGYLFAFVHPMICDQNNGPLNINYVSYEIVKGSEKEKLFYTKIDRMLNMMTKLRPNEKFDANFLFQFSGIQLC